MELYNGTGLAAKNDLQIQTSVRYLFIEITGAANAVTEALLKAAKLSWKKVGGKGQKSNQMEIDFYRAAEIMSRRSGAYQFDTVGSSFRFVYEIGHGGAIVLNNTEYISVNFSGVTAAWNLKISTVDDVVKSDRCIVINEETIASRKAIDIDLRGVQQVYFTRGNIIDLTLAYTLADANGSTSENVVYTESELLAFNFLGSDNVVGFEALGTMGKALGIAEEFITLDVTNATAAKVKLNANVTDSYFLVLPQPF